jgi:hypothetical protein
MQGQQHGDEHRGESCTCTISDSSDEYSSEYSSEYDEDSDEYSSEDDEDSDMDKSGSDSADLQYQGHPIPKLFQEQLVNLHDDLYQFDDGRQSSISPHVFMKFPYDDMQIN